MNLMDEFLASSHNLSKRIGISGRARKLADKALADYRLQVMRSKRFVLDDDFVTMATTLSSTTKAEVLLTRLGAATLPYETVWIEFDPRVKARASNAVQGKPADKPLHERVAERMGLLLTRGEGTSWSVVMFSDILMKTAWGPRPLVGPHPVVMLFDADERDFHARPTAGYPSWRTTMERKAPGDDRDFEVISDVSDDLSSMIWGYLKGGSLQEPGALAAQVPSFLRRHGSIATSWFFETLLQYFRTIGSQKEYGGWINQYAVDLYESTGLIRWIVTVLSILNEVPTTTKHVRPTTTQVVNLTKRVNLFEHHVVSLDVPKLKKPLAWVARQISGGGRKKRHEVSSHWRTYLHHETVDLHCPADAEGRRHHVWEYDNAEGYRLCTRCEAFGRLIHEHQRGDISLGWVGKDYNVKGGGNDYAQGGSGLPV